MPESSFVKVQELKVKVDLAESVMSILRSTELPIIFSPKAPIWRAKCRCLMAHNLAIGLPGARIGGLWHKLNSMVKRETTIYIDLCR